MLIAPADAPSDTSSTPVTGRALHRMKHLSAERLPSRPKSRVSGYKQPLMEPVRADVDAGAQVVDLVVGEVGCARAEEVGGRTDRPVADVVDVEGQAGRAAGEDAAGADRAEQGDGRRGRGDAPGELGVELHRGF